MVTKFLLPRMLLLPVLCLPLMLSAQDEQMTDEQMQQMMENSGKMQECMEKIDQKSMDAYAARGEKMHAEIMKLCAAGKRDEAQKMAIDYGKEMASSKEMQAMQKCGMMAKQMPMTGHEGKQGQVCDEK